MMLTKLPKSRKNTFAVLNSRARAVPSTMQITMPSTAATMPSASGCQPLIRHTPMRISSWGATCHSETSIVATGNISRGTDIFAISPLLPTRERVPAPKVSVKKCVMMRPANMCTG